MELIKQRAEQSRAGPRRSKEDDGCSYKKTTKRTDATTSDLVCALEHHIPIISITAISCATLRATGNIISNTICAMWQFVSVTRPGSHPHRGLDLGSLAWSLSPYLGSLQLPNCPIIRPVPICTAGLRRLPPLTPPLPAPLECPPRPRLQPGLRI